MLSEKRDAFPVVECPGCRKPMRVVFTEKINRARNISTYHCDQCGMDTERIFKPDTE